MGEESNMTAYTRMRKKKKRKAKYEWILKKKKKLWKVCGKRILGKKKKIFFFNIIALPAVLKKYIQTSHGIACFFSPFIFISWRLIIYNIVVVFVIH